jgi:hypothetical protein
MREVKLCCVYCRTPIYGEGHPRCMEKAKLGIPAKFGISPPVRRDGRPKRPPLMSDEEFKRQAAILKSKHKIHRGAFLKKLREYGKG